MRALVQKFSFLLDVVTCGTLTFCGWIFLRENMNKLIEIPTENWPQLRDLYAGHEDKASCYNTIQTFIDWIRQEPSLPLKIYSLNSEWQMTGTYVAHLMAFNQVFCNTLKDDLSELTEILNCFDNGHLIAGFQERVLPAVDKYFLDSGLSKDQFGNTCTIWYHISRDEALNFDTKLPENITAKDLNESYAEQINNVWPHRSEGSVNFVKMLIRLNKSVGLFEDGKLVAWCLLLPLGALGLLQVENTHKRKGFGSLVVKLLSKFLAENNIEVTAPVVVKNVASRSMFEKLGFKEVDKVYWQFKL
ncbi:uncharacterized protein LOC101899829 [Musca domestica]|uniref:Uncharacterized protein LOC101899829 n=2 Tax=Musca domestica TaxID=7370 RepID=A0ABM3VFV0_MUSDO|nr:uncharacterized protein LOC101899829 [Musca domestica]